MLFCALTANRYPLTASSIGNPYGFTGRRLDSDTGLYYYRARYYNPLIGRFLQTDPLRYVDSMNLYAYVNNSPLNYVDPLGLCGGGGGPWGDMPPFPWFWLYESALPGPYGQPLSEWGSGGPNSWGDPLGYYEAQVDWKKVTFGALDVGTGTAVAGLGIGIGTLGTGATAPSITGPVIAWGVFGIPMIAAGSFETYLGVKQIAEGITFKSLGYHEIRN